MREQQRPMPDGREHLDVFRCILLSPMPSSRQIGASKCRDVFMALAMHADTNLEAFPGLETLTASIDGCHRMDVSNAIKLLEQAGYIKHTGRYRGRAKVWRLFPKESATGPTTTHAVDDPSVADRADAEVVLPTTNSGTHPKPMAGDHPGHLPGKPSGDVQGYPSTKGPEKKGTTTCELDELTVVWGKENPSIPVDDAIARAAADPTTIIPINRLSKIPAYRQEIANELKNKRKADRAAQRATAPRCTECNRTHEECTAINITLDRELACQGHLDALRDGSRPLPAPHF